MPDNIILVDTDVISYLFKGDTRSIAYEATLTGRIPIISFMTVAELKRWVLVRNWGDYKRRQLDRHLQRFVVYPFEVALCQKWAEVMDGCQRKGHPISCEDAWIAATAVLHNLPLLTNNRKDFIGVDGLKILP